MIPNQIIIVKYLLLHKWLKLLKRKQIKVFLISEKNQLLSQNPSIRTQDSILALTNRVNEFINRNKTFKYIFLKKSKTIDIVSKRFIEWYWIRNSTTCTRCIKKMCTSLTIGKIIVLTKIQKPVHFNIDGDKIVMQK